MKTSTVLFGAAGLYLLWYISNLGTAANTIAIVFKTVILNSPLNYTVVLTVQNVSNVSAVIKSMTGELSLDSNAIASLSDFSERIVPPNGQIDIPVTVNLSLIDLPGAIQNIVTSGANELNFNVSGNVNLSSLILPFNLDKTITV
jgi:hypothetical protein